LTEPTNSERFRALALPHLDAAYNLARWLTRNDHDAEDLVQEAFLRAYAAFDGFRGDSARPWLLAIVRNACFDWLREHRKEELQVSYDDDIAIDESCAGFAGMSMNATEPERALTRADERRAVNEALAKLPPAFREVVLLRDIEELSYREIADIAAIPIGTVMSRLARARKLLHAQLASLRSGETRGL